MGLLGLWLPIKNATTEKGLKSFVLFDSVIFSFGHFLKHLDTCVCNTKGASTNHVDSRGGRGGSQNVHVCPHGGGGSRPLSMWIMIPTFLLLISGICK